MDGIITSTSVMGEYIRSHYGKSRLYVIGTDALNYRLYACQRWRRRIGVAHVGAFPPLMSWFPNFIK